MKQLSILNIARLRTEESFGYQKQVVAETANLPIGEETGTPSEISHRCRCFRRCVEGILHESRHRHGDRDG